MRRQKGKAPSDLFKPPTPADAQIVAELERAGYAIAVQFLRKPNGRYWLTAFPRVVTREGRGRNGR